MSGSQPRLRVFAGPNGSGKSTLKEVLPEGLLGVYVNADDIEKLIRADGALALSDFSIEATASPLQNLYNPHECWRSGVIPNGHNSQRHIQ